MANINSAKTTIQIGKHFQEATTKLATLGRPLKEEEPWQYAIQQFEHGWMLYNNLDPDHQNITVLLDLPQQTRTWVKFQDNWNPESNPDSCRQIQDPGGNLVEPKRGFGKAWCDLPQRAQIGFGLHVEFSKQETPSQGELYHQDFEHGSVFGGGPIAGTVRNRHFGKSNIRCEG